MPAIAAAILLSLVFLTVTSALVLTVALVIAAIRELFR